jgi:rhodanese-related sulfurtransferase
MAKLTFITLEKLLEMQANEEDFVLVDALDEDVYKEGHIPGAINIPSERIAQEAAEKVGQGATIVTYCANYKCEASTVAAAKLMDLGYENTLDFKAGKKAWKEAGFELEK